MYIYTHAADDSTDVACFFLFSIPHHMRSSRCRICTQPCPQLSPGTFCRRRRRVQPRGPFTSADGRLLFEYQQLLTRYDCPHRVHQDGDADNPYAASMRTLVRRLHGHLALTMIDCHVRLLFHIDCRYTPCCTVAALHARWEEHVFDWVSKVHADARWYESATPTHAS